MNYSLQFGQVADDIPFILAGAGATLFLAFVSFFVGLVAGMALAMAKVSDNAPIRHAAGMWIATFTNVPLLVLLFFLFNVLPEAGLLLSPIQAALIALTVSASAYLAEILRAGIISVRRTELDAAEVLGMGRLQTVRFVIAPHIARTVFAPLANFFIFLMLGTSMAGLVGVDELTGRALTISSRTFRSIEVFLIAGAAYVAMTVLASSSLAWLGYRLFRVRPKVF